MIDIDDIWDDEEDRAQYTAPASLLKNGPRRQPSRPMKQPTCATCRFFCLTAKAGDEVDINFAYSEDMGQCRRNPPTKEIIGNGWFPFIEASLWCGEHQEADQ